MVGNRAQFCESLESRRLLAATAVFDGGRLEITGTDENEAVEINADAEGNLLANGIIVGAAADLRELRVDLGGGDDDVFLHDVQVQNRVEIDMGDGNDGVLIGRPLGNIDVQVGNTLRIETGEGDDRVQFVDTSARLVTVNTGSGFDTLDPVDRVTAENFVSIEMEDGPDVVRLAEVSGKRVLVDGGGGSDLLQIDGPTSGKLVIRSIEIPIGF
jgi:hypothetical protein